MKLELGCGERPTEGYLHQDIIRMSKLDFLCNPWEIDLPIESLSEVLAIGVIEHLRFEDVRKTIKHVHKLLGYGGIFLFDVPDLTVWSKYLYDTLRGLPTPFSKDHILATFYGWQRWPGDEHKSAWTEETIYGELSEFRYYENGLSDMRARVERTRFNRPEDTHIYIKATK
jgi:predicted SAM-dependent methyltransferase